MRSRGIVLGLAVLLALAAARAAVGVGPWPGLARAVVSPSGDVRYTASRADGTTTLRAVRVADGSVSTTATFDGAYGIPAVTSNGLAGGLSPDGRVLVLSEPRQFTGPRERSGFLVVSTGDLTAVRTVDLPGEFGFDALSPDGRTLYLIHHVSRQELIRYVVRAYDLRAGRLLPRAIVDRREPSERMAGYPVARATSSGGSWVYTLYLRARGNPFVHALNAANRTAFCIDLPWAGSTDEVWGARLRVTGNGAALLVRSNGATVATIDTKTLRVR